MDVPHKSPVPPSVLLSAYASTSSTAMILPRSLNHSISDAPYTQFYAKNDDRPTNRTRPRCKSSPSRDAHAQPFITTFATSHLESPRQRPLPKHLEPRPASSSYVPRRPSPLGSLVPATTMLNGEYPVPVHAPIPLPYSLESVIYQSTALPDVNASANMIPEAVTMFSLLAPKPTRRRKLEKRKREATRTPDTDDKVCGCLSFSGLSSLFSSKRESYPTPNTLLLKQRYTERYIPPYDDACDRKTVKL